MKTYSKYKPSGIDWIGEIPSHWESKKLKYVTYLKARVGWHGLKADEFSLDENLPYCITGTDFNNGIINWETCYHINDDRYNEDTYIQLKENDLLVTKDGTIGKVAVVKNLKGRAILNSGVFVMRPTYKQYNSEFMYWLIQSEAFYEFIRYTSKGSTIIHLYQDTFLNWPIAMPPYDEQTSIANFLDEETSQIEKLISKKQKIIELLKEERTAIINEAVSGEGKNWERKKLKYLAMIKYGLGQPPKQKDDGLPLIRATNVERGKINEKDLIFVDPDDVPYERDPVLKENDIIVVRSGAYTADSAIIPKKFEGAITGYDMVVRVVKDNPFFVAFCLLSADVLINQLYLHRLRAAQPHLNKEELGETLFNMPPIEEQNAIVQHIQTQIQRIEETISNIEKEIDLMQEYRTALISEVVTGKIKVN